MPSKSQRKRENVLQGKPMNEGVSMNQILELCDAAEKGCDCTGVQFCETDVFRTKAVRKLAVKGFAMYDEDGMHNAPEGIARARQYVKLLEAVQDGKCWDEDEGTYFTACADGKCRRCTALKGGLSHD